MYYLFNNGNHIKIVDSRYDEDFNNEEILADLKDWGYIKAQSENVFDLVEVGDLVEVFKCREIGKITKKDFRYDNYNEFEVNYRDGVFTDHIMAIYKPNKNGDYICVWRKENEEH